MANYLVHCGFSCLVQHLYRFSFAIRSRSSLNGQGQVYFWFLAAIWALAIYSSLDTKPTQRFSRKLIIFRIEWQARFVPLRHFTDLILLRLSMVWWSFHDLTELLKNITLQKTRTLRSLKLRFLQIKVSLLLHLILQDTLPLLLILQHPHQCLYLVYLQLRHFRSTNLFPAGKLHIWRSVI